MDQTENTSPPFKAGYVTIAGKPNAGKSTLMNGLLDQKISIVSPRPQTTRRRVLGIRNGADHQIVFLDTPGLIEPKYALQKAMVHTAEKSIEAADLILFLMDAADLSKENSWDLDERLFSLLQNMPAPKFLLLNKIDLVSKALLLPVIDRHSKTGLFREIVPISALRRDGLDILLALILKYLPENAPQYPTDAISEQPERFFVSEIIREQIFLEYGKEIPYSAAVQIEDFKERPDRKDFIMAQIIVERDSQKGILIGSKGQALKNLGIRSRKAIEDFLGRPVYLELHVRVEKNWRRNENELRRFGYA